MLSRLFPRKPSAPAPLPQPDSQLALGALLVRVALADQTYRQTEVAAIDTILSATFEINPIEAAKLRATCTDLELHAADRATYTQILRDEVSHEERTALAKAMWQVALSDGERHELEEAMLEEIEVDLGLSADDIAFARAAALGGAA